MRTKPRTAVAATGRSTTKPRLSLSIQYASISASGNASGLPERWQFRRWVRAALERDASIALRIVDSDEGRQLNRDYRGKDYATNVLTFAYGSPSAGEAQGADIVLCAPVIADEALAQGKALTALYAHLTVHGVLHMQGYDHETVGDARTMEARECEILAGFGIASPY